MRRHRIFAAVLVGLVAIGIVLYALRPGPDLRAGSEALAAGGVSVASRTPRAYRIVYRVETRTGDESVVGTERLWVRRPFESRDEAWSGLPPGRRRTSVTISAFARVRFGEATFALPPAPAPQDRRIRASLDEVTRAGYAQARERRRVAGRLCRVYRTGGEGGSGSLKRLEPSSETYTDVCFDAAGLVLEEVTFTDGKISSRRIAVEVDESPRLSDVLFETGEPSVPARQGGGSAREVDPRSRPPGAFWELGREPSGFTRKGRYAVIPPQSGFDDPTQRSRIIAFTSDVWVRDLDVLVVEQGATLGGAEPFATDPNARRVRVGALGSGELVYGLRTTEVRVRMKAGRFVRVIGTLEPTRLLAIARSLERKPGGELVYLDELPS